jgi:sugar/nucleoside kinase (ribokinase family)
MDLLCIGELLVDRIDTGSAYERFFGGAPANVAVNYAQLGGEAALIAKVGADSAGLFLIESLDAYGVLTDGVVVDPEHRTSEIYVVSGETPCRPTRDADAYLQPGDVSSALVNRCRILHTSAFALALEPSRSAVLEAIRLAKEEGKLVSLEPNYRPWIWPDRREALQALEGVLSMADMVKPSLDDARSLYGERAPHKYVRAFSGLGPPLVVLTLEREGCLVYDEGQTTEVPGHKVEVVDSVGAGDAFWAAFLLRWLDGETPVEAATFGNAVAALKVGTLGAIAPLPRAERVHSELELRLLDDKRPVSSDHVSR